MESTQLYIRYSPIYDRTLAGLVGKEIHQEEISAGFLYAQRFSTHWKPLNQKVFDYYRGLGLTLANFWLAYPVHQQPKLIPFNDPLTFTMKEDFDEVAATVIHELCHTFFSYFSNKTRADELWLPVQKKYSMEADDVREHVMINILAAGGYYHIFGAEKAKQLIDLERTYPSLQHSWDLIGKVSRGEYDKLRDPERVLKQLVG